jgi:hypothetical protein
MILLIRARRLGLPIRMILPVSSRTFYLRASCLELEDQY